MDASMSLRELISRHGPILSHLVDHGPTTRSHLVELAGVAQPTVTRWVGELIEEGVVVELGALEEPDRPGRPSVLIDLLPEAGYIAAMHLCRGFSEVGCINLKGEVVFKHTLWERVDHTNGDVDAIDHAVETLFRLIDERGVPRERLLGLGVAVSGLVGAMGRELRLHMSGDRLQATEVPVLETIERLVAIPVSISTNAWAMALGERLFGNKETNFALIWVNEGVGSAVVIDGRLHQGRGAAGEIGHVKVASDSILCECGRAGCLAAVVSERRIVDRYQGGTEGLWGVVRDANHGNPTARSILDECARAIGAACVPIVDLLDLDAIVLAGPIFSNPEVPWHIDRFVNENAFLARLHGVRVLPTLLGRDIAIVGAASLVYGELLGSRHSDKLTKMPRHAKV